VKSIYFLVVVCPPQSSLGGELCLFWLRCVFFAWPNPTISTSKIRALLGGMSGAAPTFSNKETKKQKTNFEQKRKRNHHHLQQQQQQQKHRNK